MSALGNDLGNDQVFARPIAMYGKPDDVVLAISSSGNSDNIVEAVWSARNVGCRVVTMSGFRPDNRLRRLGDWNLYVSQRRVRLRRDHPPGLLPRHRRPGDGLDPGRRPLDQAGQRARRGMSEMNGHRHWTVLVTGGAGYVGSRLIPKLLAAGHHVHVLDLYMYGRDIFADYKDDPGLTEFVGDLRDEALVKKAVAGCDAVIHLACISNDPSFELESGPWPVDQFRCVPAAGTALPRRRAWTASSTPPPVVGLRREGRTENVHEGPAVGTADRLFQVQDDVRGRARGRA